MTRNNGQGDNDREGTIFVQACGRVAQLGELYDFRTETFTGLSMFRTQPPPHSAAVTKTDNPHSHISFTITSNLNEKLDTLGISGELKLSILAGMIEVGGSARYLSKTKTNFKSVESTLLYNVTTVVERLNVFHDDIKACISPEALGISAATHVVLGIDWGANCIVTVTDQNSENEEKTKVETTMSLQLDKLKVIVTTATAEEEANNDALQDESWKKCTLELFGDMLPESSDKFPNSLKGALEMMKKIPKLVDSYNDGKGKPLSYFLFPLSSPEFRHYLGITESQTAAIRHLEDNTIIHVLHVADDIRELVQKVHDQLDELNKHGSYVTSSELQTLRSFERELEAQYASLTSELSKLLKEIRSQERSVSCLDGFRDRYYPTAKEIFRRCDDRYKSTKTRLDFVDQCEEYGAKCVDDSINIDQHINRAFDDYENVHILFEGEADREEMKKNRSTFLQLVKQRQGGRKTVCYISCSELNEVSRIEHHRKQTFSNELDTRNVEQSRPTVRARWLVPFKVRCPGSFDRDCDREESSWTCMNCSESLQFCPIDRQVYYSCEHLEMNHFQFRCNSRCSGSEFLKSTDNVQAEVVDRLVTSSYGNAVTKKILTGGVRVLGVTSVDDKLFVLLEQNTNQVEVYSINNYQLLSHLNIHVPGYKPDGASDITSCVQRRCLYMCHYGNHCIHRYDLSGRDSSKWSVDGAPRGLSVTPRCNLLVTCLNKLVELSGDSGQRVREITLQAGINWLWHSVQLTTGQFIVCHVFQNICRVCVVGDDGKIARSYGGQRGSDVGQLNEPRHLAVDEDLQSIFVADRRNNKVVMLSPTLQFVCHFSEGLSNPCGLYSHQATSRLFVGQKKGDFAVIQLKEDVLCYTNE